MRKGKRSSLTKLNKGLSKLSTATVKSVPYIEKGISMIYNVLTDGVRKVYTVSNRLIKQRTKSRKNTSRKTRTRRHR